MNTPRLFLTNSNQNVISLKSLRIYCYNCIRKYFQNDSLTHQTTGSSRQFNTLTLIVYSLNSKSMPNVFTSICRRSDTIISIYSFIMSGPCRYNTWHRSLIIYVISIRPLSRLVSVQSFWMFVVYVVVASFIYRKVDIFFFKKKNSYLFLVFCYW